MPQFRLTAKFAKDIKAGKLPEPTPASGPFDDWVIDVIRIHRKKVAMATNVKTLITFLIPYNEAGGATSIPGTIPVRLMDYLGPKDRLRFGRVIRSLFDEDPVFSKTSDRKVLGHMNDFKNHLDGYLMQHGDDIDWNEVSMGINKTLVGTGGGAYSTPGELMADALR